MRKEEDWRRYCAWPENALSGNEAALLRDGEEAFPAMLSAIGGARDFILLEFYAFSDDSIGRAFADLLKEKAREGVGVYLIYDSVGSILTDRDFFLELAAAGDGQAPPPPPPAPTPSPSPTIYSPVRRRLPACTRCAARESP